MALNSGIKALTNQAPHHLVMRRTVLSSLLSLQSMIDNHGLVEDRVINFKVSGIAPFRLLSFRLLSHPLSLTCVQIPTESYPTLSYHNSIPPSLGSEPSPIQGQRIVRSHTRLTAIDDDPHPSDPNGEPIGLVGAPLTASPHPEAPTFLDLLLGSSHGLSSLTLWSTVIRTSREPSLRTFIIKVPSHQVSYQRPSLPAISVSATPLDVTL